jgi:hypothetical protein
VAEVRLDGLAGDEADPRAGLQLARQCVVHEVPVVDLGRTGEPGIQQAQWAYKVRLWSERQPPHRMQSSGSNHQIEATIGLFDGDPDVGLS